MCHNSIPHAQTPLHEVRAMLNSSCVEYGLSPAHPTAPAGVEGAHPVSCLCLEGRRKKSQVDVLGHSLQDVDFQPYCAVLT